MSSEVDLYGAAYRGLAREIYADIRREAFGEDIGQTGWLTSDEHDLFMSWLGHQISAISRAMPLSRASSASSRRQHCWRRSGGCLGWPSWPGSAEVTRRGEAERRACQPL